MKFDELYTILAEAEAILNSRPLTPVYDDELKETEYITAGDFLVGRPLKAAPSPKPSTAKVSSLKRWNLTQRLTADLWEQWLRSYLSTCAYRDKWRRQSRPLEVRDIVFVKDETLRVREWPVARVEKIYAGSDGQVRAADIRCGGRTYTRPTVKLILLEKEKDEQTGPGHPRNNPISLPPEDVQDSVPEQ